ncbi:MAG: hypothetical protein HYW22_02305 [Candidatus Aenigmarchaeota archaeon]|nr:hypothetical protein [Candidatus Aenigmarchaeota archaeon]
MEVMIEELISNAKAKEILEEKEKKGELKFEQKNSLDVLKRFVKIDLAKATTLTEDLRKIEKLRDRHVMNIVNFLPEDKDDLRAVLGKEYSSLTDEEIDQIIKTVKKHF